MINLILFGPPGSGKGTQAQLLEKKFDIMQISTGDLFRYEIGNSTPLGLKAKEYMSKGELVPDEVTVGMLKNKVNKHPDSKGFIYDGFPRTIAQSEALDSFLEEKGLSINALIELVVEEDEIVGRLLKRGETSGRPDDVDESIIRNRISVYHDNTAPVANYYAEKGTAHKVNGLGSIDDIQARLSSLIKTLIKA